MVGEIISHYKILEKLGEGGMGVVYKAEDTKLGRIVALKFLPHHLTANESERARFLQEARASSALNHPHVCGIHAINEYEGQSFIDMEFVDGVTLRQKISSAPLGIDAAISYAVQIGDALHEAHAHGIVHRDIKCENIMINSKNMIKVMDFGLAKLKGSLKLTRTSSTVGTIAYMAPEQIQNGEVDARSDIFSFGVVLFEMLSGRMPFRGEHEAALMYSIVNEEPDSLAKYIPDISPEIERIVRRALEKDPADRYQHVDDMVSELRRLQKKTSRVVRPERSETAGEVKAAQPTKSRSARMPLKGGIVALIVIVAGIAAWLFFNGRAEEKIASMAVLPFVNTGSDPSMEYLSDGLTEGLINGLSKIPGMKMMSSSSVFHFKGKDIDPREIGKELSVSAVLLGRITQSGDALNVSVELVSTRDNSHIWGDQYSRKMSDLVTLQSEISQDITTQLKIALTGEEQRQVTGPATENSEAYQFYLKGRFYWNKRTKDGFNKAVQYFEEAIAKDPSFARAYAGLADAYALMGSYNLISPGESLDKARAAAKHALELDDRLAEAHATLASLYEGYEWDWRNAEEEYRHALELDHNYATAHQWYGEFLSATGRYEDGLVEVRKATDLNPLSPISYASIGLVLVPLRRYDEAAQQLRKALELDPNFPRVHAQLGWTYFALNRNDDAIREMKIAYQNSDSAVEYLAAVGFLYGRTGDRKESEKVLADILRLSKVEYVPPYLMGSVCVGLGKFDEAFIWFNRAIDEHSNSMEYLKVDPIFDPVRNDPRFAQLMKKVGLPS